MFPVIQKRIQRRIRIKIQGNPGANYFLHTAANDLMDNTDKLTGGGWK